MSIFILLLDAFHFLFHFPNLRTVDWQFDISFFIYFPFFYYSGLSGYSFVWLFFFLVFINYFLIFMIIWIV